MGIGKKIAVGIIVTLIAIVLFGMFIMQPNYFRTLDSYQQRFLDEAESTFVVAEKGVDLTENIHTLQRIRRGLEQQWTPFWITEDHKENILNGMESLIMVFGMFQAKGNGEIIMVHLGRASESFELYNQFRGR